MPDFLHSTLHPGQDSLPYSRPSTPGLYPHRIGFIGLGAIGYLMARNLATHPASQTFGSLSLLVWNRTTEKSEKLAQALGSDRIRIAHDPGEVASECDIIITNLADDMAVKSIYEQFAEALTRNPPARRKIFVETSTIYPALAGDLDALISSHPHSHLVTCPVFGTPAVADKAQLLIVMSGDYISKKEVAYMLVPAVGRKVVDLGGNLEKAPTLKLIGNSMILGTLEILAEAFTLAEKSGIPADNVHELVKDILPAPGIINYSDRMLHDKFDGTTGFAINGGIKDASHIRRLTAEHNSPAPAIDVAHQHLITARAIHNNNQREGKAVFSTLDWSGIIAGTRVAAGLDGFDSAKHTNVVQED